MLPLHSNFPGHLPTLAVMMDNPYSIPSSLLGPSVLVLLSKHRILHDLALTALRSDCPHELRLPHVQTTLKPALLGLCHGIPSQYPAIS